MKFRPTTLRSACAVIALPIAASSLAPAALVYSSEDFFENSLFNSGNPYYGGHFGNQLAPETFTGSHEITIADGALKTYSTSGIRSAGILLSPSVFAATGSGEYTFSFDITSFGNHQNNEAQHGPTSGNAVVNVFSGRGTDPADGSGNRPNAFLVNTLNAELVAQGPAASVDLLATATYTAPATAITVSFSYEVGDTIAIFLGSQANGFPFPATTFENLQLSFNPAAAQAIPEPSSTLLLALFGSLALFHRRR